ncbi:ABC transporter permease subunit [Ornithinimicrobium tianjinense]|uniref:Maltose/maltodextrin transport system permease protein n=1 Tax=Ornithinimicrobium tianjinense TaxID=1195761 RepID=A0A917F6R4_9MICO|nr:ABC transporter permease subunit [Ornithinimicrobium tianjinense]GGF56271.1 sugar ABC transporter permease [Ornithinimicrobium tianjinense]
MVTESPETEQQLKFERGEPWWAKSLKWGLILLSITILFYAATVLAEAGHWLFVVITAFVAMGVLIVYATRRCVPFKYLYPGILLTLALQIWPIVYTVGMSFTNYGYGHLVSKEEAIQAIEASSVRQVEGSQRYGLAVAIPEGQDPATGEIVFLLTSPDGSINAGSLDGLEPVDPESVQTSERGRITEADGYTVLTGSQVNARSVELSEFAVPTESGGIKMIGLSEAFIGEATRVYDASSDTIQDKVTGQVFVVKDARFVPRDGVGSGLPQGWVENVGFDNYTRALTDPQLRTGFVNVIVWNFVFAFLSVITTFLLGMFLALLLNDPRLKGKAVYRSLLILPYALPGYITALVWGSMYNRDFGLINELFHLNINWLGDGTLAKIAILITNLWLGFPYMFIVCTGALQAIPSDVREAAAIDGASAFRTVRSIIMPLLLVAVGPLLIASFAFNFNNFGLIFLLTGGGPFEGGQSMIGSTDLLITMAYRLAIGGTTPNFGFAGAISVFIFIIVAVISYLGFRQTSALEDVN